MALWIVAFTLILVWFLGWLVFHAGGFIHTLLLTAIALIVVQWVAQRRAARG